MLLYLFLAKKNATSYDEKGIQSDFKAQGAEKVICILVPIVSRTNNVTKEFGAELEDEKLTKGQILSVFTQK